MSNYVGETGLVYKSVPGVCKEGEGYVGARLYALMEKLAEKDIQPSEALIFGELWHKDRNYKTADQEYNLFLGTLPYIQYEMISNVIERIKWPGKSYPTMTVSEKKIYDHILYLFGSNFGTMLWLNRMAFNSWLFHGEKTTG